MRTTEKVYCSCNLPAAIIDEEFDADIILSTVTERDTTRLENLKLGCNTIGCCVNVFECADCGTRFIFQLEAPESRND